MNINDSSEAEMSDNGRQERTDEFSWFEKYLIYTFAKWFSDTTTPYLKKAFHPKTKGFWDRVKEQVSKD